MYIIDVKTLNFNLNVSMLSCVNIIYPPPPTPSWTIPEIGIIKIDLTFINGKYHSAENYNAQQKNIKGG